MKIREQISIKDYHNCLEEKAFRLENTRGRRRKEHLDPDMEGYEGIINPWRLDFEAILDSKAIRRLRHKTQVFPTPKNEHIRTREIHTFEVVSLSRKIAMLSGLNVDLCEAIALGHDLGHPPFGHVGEEALSELNSPEKPFHHSVFGVVVSQYFERSRQGLNLSYETLNGILHHTESKKDLKFDDNIPEEYMVVRYSDKISYVFSDANDIKRFNFLNMFQDKELNEMLDYFGAFQRGRIRSCINALIKESAEEGKISFQKSKTAKNYLILKKWLYENVYKKINRKYHSDLIKSLYAGIKEVIHYPTNYIALMTDKDAISLFNLMLTKPNLKEEDLKNFSVTEVLKEIASPGLIDYSNPDLNWGK